jgi:hypothetical protein
MERVELSWEPGLAATSTGRVRPSTVVPQESAAPRLLRPQRPDRLLEAGRPVLRDITRFIVGKR